MLRGRRVILAWLFILFLLANTSTVLQAAELSVTAKVPLSTLWKQSIEQNSLISLVPVRRNIISCTVQIKGMQDVLFPNQTVQAILFEDNVVSNIQEKKTDETGKTSFEFVYAYGKNHRIILVNKTFEYPFTVKAVGF